MKLRFHIINEKFKLFSIKPNPNDFHAVNIGRCVMVANGKEYNKKHEQSKQSSKHDICQEDHLISQNFPQKEHKSFSKNGMSDSEADAEFQ